MNPKQALAKNHYRVQHHGSCSRCQHAHYSAESVKQYCGLITDTQASIDPNGSLRSLPEPYRNTIG